MITLINKESTQHYANKMVLAENRKVGSKSLPTALNEIDALIDEMKTYFDAEYGSALDMKLKNNENIFSVGTGTNVNKSSEVENSFTDVELNGNSLVNLFDYKSFIPNASGGIYAENNGIKFIVTQPSNSYFYQSFKKPIYKDTTDYTFIVNITKNTFASNIKVFRIFRPESTNGEGYWINGGITGLQKIKITTDSKASDWNGNTTNFGFNCYSSGEFIIKDMILLEGDWTNKPIPHYFEGLKSIGEKKDGNHKISILSIGKNIILDSEFKNQNGEWERFMGEVTQGYSNNVGYTIKYSGTGDYYDVLSQKLYDCNTNQNNILPNTWYTLSFYAKGNIMRTYIYPSLIDTSVKGFVNGIETTLLGDGCYAHNLTNEWTKFTYTFKTKSQIPYRDLGHSLLFRAMPNSDCVISCLILEQGKVATEYKPQQVDKKEISLNEPLRGLPNGTRDTIEKIDNEWKLIRRCGFRTITGDEHWTWSNSGQQQSEEIIAVYFIEAESKEYSILLSDKQASLTKYEWDHFVREGIYRGSSGFGLTIRRNRLSDSSSLVPIKE